MRSIRLWVGGCIGGCIVCVLLAASWLVRVRPAGSTESDAPAPSDVSNPSSAESSVIMSVGSVSFGNGRWYLADTRSHQLHVLDSAGRVVRSIGRRGRGPGEFVVPLQVAAGAAQVFVSELGRPALSVFDSSGRFRRHLRVRGACANGRVVAMSVLDTSLYVLRHCVELPGRVRYQVERSIGTGPLEIWNAVADTTLIEPGAALPLQMPLFGAMRGRLILGDGNVGCFRIFRLPDGRPQGERCLYEVDRRPLPATERDRLIRKARGRVAVPDSLPRVVGLLLLDTTILVQSAQTVSTSSWLEVPWLLQARPRIRQISAPHAAQSFVNGRSRLIAWDDANGVRLEVVPIER